MSSWIFAGWNRPQKLLLCKKRGLDGNSGVSIESAPIPEGSSYEIVTYPDGLHLTMNQGTHDFGLIIDQADTMGEAILKAQEWRPVVAVMES
jgi:hypothetical protein